VFALFPPLTGRHRGKAARKEAYAERARKEIEPWLAFEPPEASRSSPSP